MKAWEPKVGEPCEVLVFSTGKWEPGVIKEVWVNPTIRLGAGNLNRLSGNMYVVKFDLIADRTGDRYCEMIPDFVRPASSHRAKR